jgi:hypothetical protein
VFQRERRNHDFRNQHIGWTHRNVIVDFWDIQWHQRIELHRSFELDGCRFHHRGKYFDLDWRNDRSEHLRWHDHHLRRNDCGHQLGWNDDLRNDRRHNHEWNDRGSLRHRARNAPRRRLLLVLGGRRTV